MALKKSLKSLFQEAMVTVVSNLDLRVIRAKWSRQTATEGRPVLTTNKTTVTSSQVDRNLELTVIRTMMASLTAKDRPAPVTSKAIRIKVKFGLKLLREQ